MIEQNSDLSEEAFAMLRSAVNIAREYQCQSLTLEWCDLMVEPSHHEWPFQRFRGWR